MKEKEELEKLGIEYFKKELLKILAQASAEHEMEDAIHAAALKWVRENYGDGRSFDAGARWAIEYMKSKTT